MMKNLNSRTSLISRCFLLVALELVYFTSEWQNQYHTMPQGKMVTDTGEGNIYAICIFLFLKGSEKETISFLSNQSLKPRYAIVLNRHDWKVLAAKGVKSLKGGVKLFEIQTKKGK